MVTAFYFEDQGGHELLGVLVRVLTVCTKYSRPRLDFARVLAICLRLSTLDASFARFLGTKLKNP